MLLSSLFHSTCLPMVLYPYQVLTTSCVVLINSSCLQGVDSKQPLAWWLFIQPDTVPKFLAWLVEQKKKFEAEVKELKKKMRAKKQSQQIDGQQQETAAAAPLTADSRTDSEEGKSKRATPEQPTPARALQALGRWVIPVKVMEAAAAHFGDKVQLVKQHHGETVYVPASVPHAVTTTQPKLSIATDVIVPSHLPLYALAHATIASKYIHFGGKHLQWGPYSGKDYTCWLRMCVCLLRGESTLEPFTNAYLFQHSC